MPTERYSAASDAVIAEIATSLTISTRSASRLYDDAYLVCTRPALIDALHAGRLDMTLTKLIAVLLPTSGLQDRLEADAIARGTTHTTHQLRRWLLSRLPDGDAAARKTAFEERCVRVTPDRDGMSDVFAYLPTEIAEALYTTLHTIARANTVPDDDRTLDQRHRRPPRRTHHRDHQRERGPARFRDRGHRQRLPAARCDLDHTIAFPDGPTTDDNLRCLCRRHHRLKHQTGWTVTNLGNNELRWTSPAGRTYHTKPPDAFNHAA